jgi:ABC-type oligopeptide transport system ATPase subunit
MPEHDVKRIKWRVLEPAFMSQWAQGEHFAIIGPTGQGKTTLAISLLNDRVVQLGGSVVIMATKQKDEGLQKLLAEGWQLVREWPPTYEQRISRRIIFWPKYTKASSSASDNRDAFLKAFDGILEEQNWTVYLDEVIYFIEQLKLRTTLDEFWNTGRSSGLTLVASSQGVTWIPRAMITQQSWLISFHVKDVEVQKRISQIAGERNAFIPVIQDLRRHEFLIVDTLRGDAYISRLGT